MKGLPVLALLLFASLAGCGGKGTPTTHTCADGSIVDLGTESRADGFDPESLCMKPVPPSIHLGAASYTVGLYRSIPITWTILNGTRSGGHAMISIAKLSHHSVPASELSGPTSYGIQDLVGGEVHQNLPHSFNFTTPAGAFTTSTLVGTRYMRVYAQIRADGLPLGDYWSDEVTINITPVVPTGKTWTITHPAPSGQAGLSPAAVSAKLGDGIDFENDDVLPHTFTEKSKPSCANAADAVPLASGVPTKTTGPAKPILLLCPGTYTFESNDQPSNLSVAVTVSAD